MAHVVTDGSHVFWDKDGSVGKNASLVLRLNDFFCTKMEVDATHNAKIEISHEELAVIINKAHAAQDRADKPPKRKLAPEAPRRHAKRRIGVDKNNPRAEPDTVYDPARGENADESSQEDDGPSRKRTKKMPGRGDAHQQAD
jgi:hypothetical protein